jgi:TonB family protein
LPSRSSCASWRPLGSLPRQENQDQTIRDQDIHIVHFEPVNYPHLARQTRIEGVVVVRVALDADGKVTDAVALSGHSLFDSRQRRECQKMAFQIAAQHAATIIYNFKIYLCKSSSAPPKPAFHPPNSISATACAVELRT